MNRSSTAILRQWVTLLNQGMETRNQLVLQLAASPEFQAIQQRLFLYIMDQRFDAMRKCRFVVVTYTALPAPEPL